MIRWRWLWPRLAEALGAEPAPFPDQPEPLEPKMAGMGDAWRSIAEKHNLAEPDLGRLASAWHTDADLGREVECIADMTKSREAGFPRLPVDPRLVPRPVRPPPRRADHPLSRSRDRRSCDLRSP